MKNIVAASLMTAGFIYSNLKFNGGIDDARYIGSAVVPIIMTIVILFFVTGSQKKK